MPVEPITYPENLWEQNQQYNSRTDDIRDQYISHQKIGVEKPRNPLGVNTIQPRTKQNEKQIQCYVQEYRKQFDRSEPYRTTPITQVSERQRRKSIDGYNSRHHQYIILMLGIPQQPRQGCYKHPHKNKKQRRCSRQRNKPGSIDPLRLFLLLIVGKPKKWVSGKDVILHIIGRIGVDGALYKSMEFVGDGIANLSMDDRFTIANMAIEAGGKNGIFPVDEKAIAYMKEHSKRPYKVFEADPDAQYDAEYTIDLSTLRPTVAFPHLPENTHTIDEIHEMDAIAIDQVVIGSCTNGRIDDLRTAAKVLKGRHVAKGMRCIVIPATQSIYMQAMEEGLLKTFIEAGAVVSTPTCGPCLGGYMGILAEGERCVSTTNRNFVGRMGHVKSEIYLASPAVAAASAITGKISCPCELK